MSVYRDFSSYSGKMNVAPIVQVFQPSRNEFQDFNNYIEYMESKGAYEAGLIKVIPPPGWVPRQKSYFDDDVMNMIISKPIRQSATMVNSHFGVFNQYNRLVKPMTVAEYKTKAESKLYDTPVYKDFNDLEKKYWKNIQYNNPIYGAGVSSTLFDNSVKEWNLSNLKTTLNDLKDVDGITIDGVNTPYLYMGMWKSMFSWHIEDMNLYSINYLHEGKSKIWYSIPPKHGRRFEELAAKLFPDNAASCNSFLRHKTTVISPAVLDKHSIPYNVTIQNQGEFIITIPYTYHSGFNKGFNIAEAVNFGSNRWIDYGIRAAKCLCKGIGINFSMDTFIQNRKTAKYDMGTHTVCDGGITLDTI